MAFEEKLEHNLNTQDSIESLYKLLEDDLENIAGDNFNYIQLYFERVLSILTINNELWEMYINYMEEKCKKGSMKKDFYIRALKNCFQNYEFWTGYMRELEKDNCDFSIIEQTGSTAI